MASTWTPEANEEEKEEKKEVRFACPQSQCNSTFGRKYDAARHVRGIHEGIRFYCSAPGCSFSANQKTGLHTHMNKHTGRKPYVCPECPVAYKDRSCLNRHKKNKHGHIPYHTSGWYAHQARKNARASPYDVSAPAARGTARAKKAAAAAPDVASSSASGYSFSLPSLHSDTSAPTFLPVTPSSGFSQPTPALSSIFDASNFSSSPISSVAFTDFHDVKEDVSALNLSDSIPGYTPQYLAAAQCSPYLVQDLTYGYIGAFDDVHSQLSYDAGAFDPAWGLPAGSPSWGQQPQYSPSQPLYQDPAVFQPAAGFYGGAVHQYTAYALPPFEQFGAIPAHEQYTRPAVEQPTPASVLSELEPLVNGTDEKLALWAKFNMTQRQQSARFAF